MGLTFHMSPVLTQAEGATWAEALSSWCLWGNPRSPVWLELRVAREKGQKTKQKRKEGPEHAGLVGPVKILVFVPGQWKATCKCHVEGTDEWCVLLENTGSMWRRARRSKFYMETSSKGPIILFCFLAWGPDEGRVCLPCCRTPQALLGILFSLFSSAWKVIVSFLQPLVGLNLERCFGKHPQLQAEASREAAAAAAASGYRS